MLDMLSILRLATKKAETLRRRGRRRRRRFSYVCVSQTIKHIIIARKHGRVLSFLSSFVLLQNVFI